MKNKDGSISTVRSITIEADGIHYVIPTVVDGKVVSNSEAIKHFQSTGETLGGYKSEKAATAAAIAIHNDEAKKLSLR